MGFSLIMQRRRDVLVPATAADLDRLHLIANENEVRCNITQPRNLRFHKFYWALLSKVVENSDQFRTPEALHVWLKVRLGFLERIEMHPGYTVPIVRSTAFDHCGEPEFREYVDRALMVLVEEVLPGITSDELAAEIVDMLSGPRPWAEPVRRAA